MTITAGIDVGSVAAKSVVTDGERIVGKAVTRTGTDPEGSAKAVFEEALDDAGVSRSDVQNVVSTGYGRRLIKHAGKVITEISAAGRGAYVLGGRKACLVLDLGGQDTKAIEVLAGGDVDDFLMNDKCAAGTGRFLEMMAGVLETDLDGLSDLALKAENAVTINSTCSVFAESEVISLISNSVRKEDIASGILNSISQRIASMTAQFGAGRDTFFCGGGAQSPALKKALEKATGRVIEVLPDPQFVVALGAALS